MIASKFIKIIPLILGLGCICANAQYHETNRLVGLHFSPNQETYGGLTAPPVYTGAEAIFGDSGGPEGSMTIVGDGGGWLLDFVATDVEGSNAPFWQWAWQGGSFGPTNKSAEGYMALSLRRATQGGKKNTPIVRLQPAYGRNVPHPSDPYTNANFASDAQAAAQLMKDSVRYYVIGNEVNIRGENHRFSSASGGLNLYDDLYDSTPEAYAQTYLAVREALSLITVGSAGRPVALMQPVSTHLAGVEASMDGNEFLWRQIRSANAVDPTKVDGFAIHAYAQPGGTNAGVDGFMDSITEQLSILGQLGQADKPVFLTEFNKDMPNATEQVIGAAFVQQAYQRLAAWNAASGGILSGLPNQNIVGTAWFVYPSAGGAVTDGWNRYSLEYWKNQIASPTPANSVWYAFQAAALTHNPAGIAGGGATWPVAAQWWRDDFNGSGLDHSLDMPAWSDAVANGGSFQIAGGKIAFKGNGNQYGSSDIKTRGAVFGDFTLETEFVFTDASKAAASSPEANFDLRLREGSAGYSLTFFTSPSPANPGHIILRRTGVWSTVGSFDVAVPGGINTTDTFRVRVVAVGDNLSIQAYKNGAVTSVMDWNVNDPTGPKVGSIRVGSYALAQVDVDHIVVGGPSWDFTTNSSIGCEAMTY
ncbi:hypothetical protein CVU37_12325 [candidate division BRC1 bacterium HGW-BRC1-1]|nr:MAG: hypothetical protein CVU37_12325 [candidate division BRC1 bacterium HGW-BRC1-1]